MITFKQFLSEARMAPLYHGTHNKAAIGILKENIIRRGLASLPNIHPSKDNKIISLTRNIDFAKNWAEPNTIVFQLNQAKISQRYKITPFSFFGAAGMEMTDETKRNFGYPLSSRKPQTKKVVFENQYEEAVHQDIKDARKYIDKVFVPFEYTAGELRDLLDKYNIPYERYK